MSDDAEKLQDVGFMQDIISYVFDEKKIVTYKWISKTLNIHVNKAKQLMYTFIKHLPDERLQQLEVTYLLGGILPDNRGCRIQVVSKEDLSKVKELFKVITSEHIYSVSSKYCLTDLHDLYSVDGVKTSELPKHGALRCEQSVERTDEELAAKRRNARIAVDDGKQWPKDKPKEQNGTAGNDKKKSSTSISAMFANSSNKKKIEESSELKKIKDEPKKEEVSVVKKVPSGKAAQKNVKAPGGGRLAAMFSAQSSKPKPVKKDLVEVKTEKSEIKKAEAPEKPVLEKKPEVPEKPVMEKKPDLQSDPKGNEKETQKKGLEEKQKRSYEKRPQNSKSKQKKRKVCGKDDKNKKRKRIVMMADSDSSEDDVFGSEEDEEEAIDRGRCPNLAVEDDEPEDIHENNEKNEEVINPEEQTKKGRARKRVVVNKTFMDEEGYIVSKKIVEFVSCSEEEDEKENEKAAQKEKNIAKRSGEKMNNDSSKTSSPPEKKKQATLMSFFKLS